MPDESKSPGRPTDYDPKYVAIATTLCELGATDFELAEAFQVHERTVRTWRHKHPEFAAACATGKDPANTRVERSLYARATGYSFRAEKILVVEGAVVCVPYTEHVPPDTTACIFWLKNRRPDIWRDKLENDAPTKPCDVSANPLSEEEWARKYGSGSSRAN